ncbi:VOC family protein [Streptomyces zingiberis]|uniref:VOC family protein n=1 Tax=Streptomyces zingiberis TaxID=2053010 RepID=A0ABX1BWN8_9ACTN|nr:VOC family protein [Streptomyces zingiberis]NJQ00295.1 VOC family protein [Streptomyces zingiberis]
MPAANPVVQGAPCWVSLITADLQEAMDFYGRVLGWEYKPGFHRREYRVAHLGGVPVAGVGALARTMGFPVAWSPYFAVSSADRAADRIRERGATVAVGPIEFGPGRVAWAADPTGAPFGIWEGVTEPKWPVRRGPGFPAWLELRTRDVFAATIFYSETLGWDTEPPERCEVRYVNEEVLLRVEGRPVGGLRGGALEEAPDPRIRPRWHVHFCAVDVNAAVERAVAAGGEVVVPPEESEHGLRAKVRDSQGGLFTLTSDPD